MSHRKGQGLKQIAMPHRSELKKWKEIEHLLPKMPAPPKEAKELAVIEEVVSKRCAPIFIVDRSLARYFHYLPGA